MIKKLKDWLIWFFTDNSDSKPVAEKPINVMKVNIFQSLYDSIFSKVKNTESNFIYRYKSDYNPEPDRFFSSSLDKCWIRSNNSGELEFDTIFYSHIRKDTFTINLPDYIQGLIDIYNINPGSVFSLKSAPNKLWRVVDFKPMIVSKYNPNIEKGKFHKRYSWEDYQYTVVFELVNLDRKTENKFTLLSDFVLVNKDQSIFKFREEVKEHIEDYFIHFIDNKSVRYNFNLSSGDYVANVNISFLKKDQDSILKFMEDLMTIKKRIETINKLSFRLVDIGMDGVKINLCKVI